MKDELSPSAALASAGAAVIARLFYGLMLDSPEVCNGAWLSALLGLVLALPALGLVRRWLRRGHALPLILLLLAFMDWDASRTLECTAFSESFIAFNHVPMIILALPLLAAMARCLWLGGDALGASARVWLLAFVPLMAVVVLSQWPYYRPAWLTPLLGFGIGGILRGGVRSAVWITTIGGAAMALCREDLPLSKTYSRLALAAAVAALLIVLRQMMAPVMDAAGMRRSIQLDALLTNGRAPMVLQLPMIVVWFIAMLHLLCFETWAAMALLRRLFPKMSRLPAAAMALVTVGMMALRSIRG